MGFASAAITAIKNNRSLQRLTSGFKQAKEETARRHPPKKLSGRAMSRVQMARRRRLWVELLLIGAVLAGAYLLMQWLFW
jgi:type VI protein secretion system component VasF